MSKLNILSYKGYLVNKSFYCEPVITARAYSGAMSTQVRCTVLKAFFDTRYYNKVRAKTNVALTFEPPCTFILLLFSLVSDIIDLLK